MAINNKQLILKYFNSWQRGDFKALRDSLHENVEFDMNGNKIYGADSFIEMCKDGIKWQKVDLLDNVFEEDKAALIYDGITEKGALVRVAEIISIKKSLIIKSYAAIVGEA